MNQIGKTASTHSSPPNLVKSPPLAESMKPPRQPPAVRRPSSVVRPPSSLVLPRPRPSSIVPRSSALTPFSVLSVALCDFFFVPYCLRGKIFLFSPLTFHPHFQPGIQGCTKPHIKCNSSNIFALFSSKRAQKPSKSANIVKP
jgi:hypothetical protein